MNIIVRKEGSSHSHETGGEYAILALEIIVDDNLPLDTQEKLVVHAVIENYCRSWQHSKVEELTEYIWDALEQLE